MAQLLCWQGLIVQPGVCPGHVKVTRWARCMWYMLVGFLRSTLARKLDDRACAASTAQRTALPLRPTSFSAASSCELLLDGLPSQ
jgi:hypothetical protein